jgi:hypothetical protein
MVLMPMTLPRESSSGPPLLPGLMAASVWIRPSIIAVFILQTAAERTDDAGGERAFEAEGVADGEHFLADLKVVGIAQAHEGSLRSALILQQREIAAAIGCPAPWPCTACDRLSESVTVMLREPLMTWLVGDDLAGRR